MSGAPAVPSRGSLRYPVTTGLGARGVIVTPAFAVAVALAWLPSVLLALALMVRDTA